MNIDITKKYTTRSGLPVRVYATDAGGIFPVHGAVGDWTETKQWSLVSWLPCGKRCNTTTSDDWDLLPVKTWRAWKEGEAPVRVMLRQKGICSVETKRTKDCDLPTLFLHYIRVHEDGTETPCGVES